MRRRERDPRPTHVNGGPGFSWFDRRLERDGVWYELSREARILYACGYLPLENQGLVESTQRELIRATSMAFKTIIRAREELERAGLIHRLPSYTSTNGDVIELLPYNPSLAKHRERVEEEEATEELIHQLSSTPAIREIQERAFAKSGRLKLVR